MRVVLVSLVFLIALRPAAVHSEPQAPATNAAPARARGATDSSPAATGPAGRWQSAPAGAMWIFDLAVNGTTLTGSIRQGAQGEPVTISAGKIDGNTIAFQVLSPDGERTITFRGRVYRNELSFVREIKVLAGGTRGGNDLYGGSAPLQFIARRVASTP
jgi:hypothetical protein